jgi:hypothetical protein
MRRQLRLTVLPYHRLPRVLLGVFSGSELAFNVRIRPTYVE